MFRRTDVNVAELGAVGLYPSFCPSFLPGKVSDRPEIQRCDPALLQPSCHAKGPAVRRPHPQRDDPQGPPR